ncbi:hypothetical protein ACQ5TV_08645 [Acetobacter ghanensis]|uniref:hypothetical protein n=1 Tax=Acetobacter ghanensis TaxID=431306 RepID=UPI003D339EA5
MIEASSFPQKIRLKTLFPSNDTALCLVCRQWMVLGLSLQSGKVAKIREDRKKVRETNAGMQRYL